MRGRTKGQQATYTPVPPLPERSHTQVEADANEKCTRKDGTNEDTCDGQREQADDRRGLTVAPEERAVDELPRTVSWRLDRWQSKHIRCSWWYLLTTLSQTSHTPFCHSMLGRRAVVATVAIVSPVPSIRRMLVSTVEDLMHASGLSKRSINPITRGAIRGAPAKVAPAGPPVTTGPVVYDSPGKNPLSKRFSAADGSGLRLAVRPSHRFDCNTTRNNTITTLSSLTYNPDNPFKPPISNVLAWFSGGSVGYKKAQRATFEAAHQCAIRIFKLIEEAKAARPDEVRVHIYFRGFGPGREAIKTALMAPDGDNIRDTIKQLTDRTPIKIGGTRAKKTRRL